MDINFNSFKNGQGTTTLICGVARALLETGGTVRIITNDPQETIRVLGSNPRGLTVSEYGSSRADWQLFDQVGNLREGINVLVTKACYLSITKILDGSRTGNFDGFILIDEPGRALTSQDVANVTGLKLLGTVPYDPSISRSVDAGLIGSRLIREFETVAAKLEEMCVNRYR